MKRDAAGSDRERRVLVLATTPKDALLAEGVLRRAGVAVTVCADLGCVCDEIELGAGAVLLPEEENSTVSAPRRLAASEKLLRVRVEFSKNKFARVRPVSTLILRRQSSVAALKRSAVSSKQFNSSAERLSASAKSGMCFFRTTAISWPSREKHG